MNKREELKSLLESAMKDLSKTTLSELTNIEKSLYGARESERHEAYSLDDKTWEGLKEKPEYIEAKKAVLDAERVVLDLKTKYRPESNKKHKERMDNITRFYLELFSQTNFAMVRKQQLLRAKATDKEKKGK